MLNGLSFFTRLIHGAALLGVRHCDCHSNQEETGGEAGRVFQLSTARRWKLGLEWGLAPGVQPTLGRDS